MEWIGFLMAFMWITAPVWGYVMAKVVVYGALKAKERYEGTCAYCGRPVKTKGEGIDGQETKAQG